MRTTIRIDDALLRDAKTLAAQTGRTLTAVIEDSLRVCLATRSRHGAKHQVRLPTRGGNGVLPGIDLDDSAALLDAIDGDAGNGDAGSGPIDRKAARDASR